MYILSIFFKTSLPVKSYLIMTPDGKFFVFLKSVSLFKLYPREKNSYSEYLDKWGVTLKPLKKEAHDDEKDKKLLSS